MATNEVDAPVKGWGARARLWRWAGWFGVANAGLLLLVSWRYLRLVDWPGEAPAQVFLVLAVLGQFSLLALAPWVIIAGVALVWPNRWAVAATGILVSGLLLLGILVDSVVFTLFRFHLNGMVWSLIRNGGITEILPLSVNTWATAVGLAALVLIAEVGAALWATRRTRAWDSWSKYLGWGGALVLAAGQLLHVWADAAQYTPITKLPRYLPAYRPLTAKRTLRRLGWKIKRGEKFKAQGTALKYPLEPLAVQPPPRPLNLLIIVVDGWRYDMLSEAITPHLHRFSQRALRFEHHSAAANSTRFGIFTLLYGLYGTYWHAVLAEQKGPVLIAELNQARYQFGVFASARLTSPEFDRTVFSEIRDRIPLQTPGSSTPERDREISRRMLAFLDERRRDQPFFGFLFYDSTHGYDYPPRLSRALSTRPDGGPSEAE
jgi:membrane-anchored protein YejM (alkaline phosphatase superfamily)